MPRWAKVVAATMAVLALGAMAFAVFQPVQVLPRLRLAPGYALVDQTGARVTSEDGRGVITLYAFVPPTCLDECEEVNATLSEVRARVDADVDLGPATFRVVTVLVDGAATPEAVSAAPGVTGTDWSWLIGSESQLENVVGLGFRRPTSADDVTPSYAIVDGAGLIRGEYRYQTIATDADKLVRHVDVLGGELRNRGPFTSFVYEAAHAFQCYP